MTDQTSAQRALFTEIERQATILASSRNTNTITEAEVLRNLALAYRLVAGGPQPGGAAAN